MMRDWFLAAAAILVVALYGYRRFTGSRTHPTLVEMKTGEA